MDKVGDNWDKSPIVVDKWRISSIMSCCYSRFVHDYEIDLSTYPQRTYLASYLISRKRFAKLLRRTTFEEPKRFFAHKFKCRAQRIELMCYNPPSRDKMRSTPEARSERI